MKPDDTSNLRMSGAEEVKVEKAELEMGGEELEAAYMLDRDEVESRR
jgi:hypothetical protein